LLKIPEIPVQSGVSGVEFASLEFLITNILLRNWVMLSLRRAGLNLKKRSRVWLPGCVLPPSLFSHMRICDVVSV